MARADVTRLARTGFVCALLLLPVTPASASALRVADGDTFEIAGQRFRLQDIDAPELHQNCRDAAGREWACGRQARNELRRLIGGNAVNCTPAARDRFGRTIATCEAGGQDLGEAMVRAGYATAYKGRGFVSRYGEAEAQARREKRGMWSGSFERPRDWRSEHPRDDWRMRDTPAVPDAVRSWFSRLSETMRRGWSQWTGRLRDRDTQD